jgi:cytoskeletal protein RodZ
MERLKLAILKAKDSAAQSGAHPAGAAKGGASPRLAADPAEAFARVEPASTGRALTTRVAPLLMLGLVAALLALWSMRPAIEKVPPPTMVQAAEAAPAPMPDLPAAVAPSPSPIETTATADSAEPPAAATEEPEAATAVSAAERAEPQIAMDEQVKAAVEAWRQAWSARDVPTYLEAYGKAFTPPNGATRKDWVASRYRNVGGRKAIDVQIKDLQVLSLEDGRARVSFLQDYASGSYKETKQPKTLVLVLEADARWRIVDEWQGKAQSVAKGGDS